MEDKTERQKYRWSGLALQGTPGFLNSFLNDRNPHSKEAVNGMGRPSQLLFIIIATSRYSMAFSLAPVLLLENRLRTRIAFSPLTKHFEQATQPSVFTTTSTD
ncbi:MAG: hypothetical protein ACR2KZ_09160 [Segetibacter sp.]